MALSLAPPLSIKQPDPNANLNHPDPNSKQADTVADTVPHLRHRCGQGDLQRSAPPFHRLFPGESLPTPGKQPGKAAALRYQDPRGDPDIRGGGGLGRAGLTRPAGRTTPPLRVVFVPY